MSNTTNKDRRSCTMDTRKQSSLSPLSKVPAIDLCYSDESNDDQVPFNNIQHRSKQKRVKVEEENTNNEHASKKVKTEDNNNETSGASKTVTPNKPRRCGLCNEPADECHMELYGKHCFSSCKKAIHRNGAKNMSAQDINNIFFRSYLNAAEYYSMLKLNEVVDYSHLKDVDLPPCMVAITYEDTMIYFQKQLSRVIKKNIQRKKNRSQSMVRED